MALVANDILTWVEQRILCEDVVNTTLGTNVATGSHVFSPASMVGIFVGAQLIVGGTSPEIITVSAVTATTATAIFISSHIPTDPLYGATFPRGQTPDPLFSQAEMLGYLADVLNDFLLKTWPVYNIVQSTISTQIRAYDAPGDAIRIEHMSFVGPAGSGWGNEGGGWGTFPWGDPTPTLALWDVSVSDLDMKDPNWTGRMGRPAMYYEDELNVGQFGIYPLPDNNYPSNIWYSQRAPVSLTLLSPLLIPDPLAYIPYYGLMAQMFDKDGEMRDPQRQEYCQKRYSMGVEIVIRLLEGIQAWASPGPPEQGA